MTILDRLKKVHEHSGLTLRAFAINCGISQPTLDKQFKGLRGVSIETISSVLTAYPSVSAEWLIRGEGEMLKQEVSSKELERINKLTNVAETLQDVIDSKNQTIADLTERIKQLESQLNK